jgi:hypothetical protein
MVGRQADHTGEPKAFVRLRAELHLRRIGQEVMDDVQPLDANLQIAGQRVVRCDAIDEAGLSTP